MCAAGLAVGLVLDRQWTLTARSEVRGDVTHDCWSALEHRGALIHAVALTDRRGRPDASVVAVEAMRTRGARTVAQGHSWPPSWRTIRQFYGGNVIGRQSTARERDGVNLVAFAAAVCHDTPRVASDHGGVGSSSRLPGGLPQQVAAPPAAMDFLAPQPFEVACFPYAQHFLTSGYPEATPIRDEEGLVDAVREYAAAVS